MDMRRFASEHLRSEDVQNPFNCTIAGVSTVTVQDQAGRSEEKAALHFREIGQTLLLNKTNTRALIDLFGPESAAWVNQTVRIFVDPNVQMAGKVVGGLRVSGVDYTPPPAPDGIPQPQPQPPVPQQERLVDQFNPPWDKGAGSGPIHGSGS